MQRVLSVARPVSDAHYAGLRAPDGTDISSRAKHRTYMKDHDVTLASDFTNTWAAAAQQREALRKATFDDKHLHDTVVNEVNKHAGN